MSFEPDPIDARLSRPVSEPRGNAVVPRRVVITGLGPVTSAGIGVEAFFKGIWGGRCLAQRVPPDFARYHSCHSLWYVPLPEVSLVEHGLATPNDSLMQPADRLALLATKLALEDAGFQLRLRDGHVAVAALSVDVSVLLGMGMGFMQSAFESYLVHCVPHEVLTSNIPGHRLTYDRMVVTRSMPNSAAAWIAMTFGFHGSAHTLNASCASGTYAIGEAFRRIRHGDDILMLAGGVECLKDDWGMILRGFDTLGALTRSADGRPCPFGARRSGFLFAEGGACLLVLEELEHALRRGARIYAEILDYRASSDAHHIVQGEPDAAQVIRLLRGLGEERRIDYLNAHGTATVANDALEARAIQTVFGPRAEQPLVNSTKGVMGHTLGASGAIEAAVTTLSVERDTVHPNVTDEPFNDLNLPLEPTGTKILRAISVSYGFGGHNGGLLLGKPASSHAC